MRSPSRRCTSPIACACALAVLVMGCSRSGLFEGQSGSAGADAFEPLTDDRKLDDDGRDCAGELGGRAVRDACGICDGDGDNDCRPTRVHAERYHSCAVRAEDGRVVCWGANLEGQNDSPDEAFSALALGDRYTCGLRELDGVAMCWGSMAGHEATAPPGIAFRSLAAGRWHNCGVPMDGGPVICWGEGADDEALAPDGLVLTQVTAGDAHTCGIEADGTAVCWGNDRYGQASPPRGLRFSALAAGRYHTCGLLLRSRTAVCWGIRDDPLYEFGQTDAPAEVRFSALSAGTFHNCGLRVNAVIG